MRLDPLFATRDLAERIDRAEARLTESLARAVVDSKTRGDAFVEEIAGGVAAYTAPSSPMNKMIGVGFDDLPDDARLDAIEALFRDRSAPLQAEVSTLADPAFAECLTRRGYALEGFENVLGRLIDDSDSDRESEACRIELLDERQADLWVDAAVDGFLDVDAQGVPPPPFPDRERLRSVLHDFARVPGFRRYCAWIDGELAAVASLRLDRGVAQLCGATTLSRFRRRGLQTAMLRRRLVDARREGCELAVMTTLPGSKSQENGHRRGFALLYVRALLVKHSDPR